MVAAACQGQQLRVAAEDETTALVALVLSCWGEVMCVSLRIKFTCQRLTIPIIFIMLSGKTNLSYNFTYVLHQIFQLKFSFSPSGTIKKKKFPLWCFLTIHV
jgi:hypothetical protein